MVWGTCYTDDDLASCDPRCHAEEDFVASMEMVKGATQGDDGIARGEWVGDDRGGCWAGMGREESVGNRREGGGESDATRRTVIYAKADVDGRDVGEGAVEEDGDVEEEVVLAVGCFGCLHVDVCEECLYLDPQLEAGCGRCKCVGEEDDDERVGGGGGGGNDGGVEMAGDVEAVEGGDEQRAFDRCHRGNIHP